jgi:hypothetical protein
MNRLDRPDGLQTPPDFDVLNRLHRAGWSIGDVASSDGAGGLSWLVWDSRCHKGLLLTGKGDAFERIGPQAESVRRDMTVTNPVY